MRWWRARASLRQRDELDDYEPHAAYVSASLGSIDYRLQKDRSVEEFMGFSFDVKKLAVLMCVGGISVSAAAQETAQCIVGELPRNAMPRKFEPPHVPWSCWRSEERDGDGRGINMRVTFDVTPEGRTENIRVATVDPPCAAEHIEKAVKEWQFDCSDKGLKNKKMT